MDKLHQKVNERCQELGFDSIEAYMTKNLHKPLTKIAEEMGVNYPSFQKFYYNLARKAGEDASDDQEGPGR